MRRNVVVVVDDDAGRRQETIKALKTAGIEAYPQADTPADKPIMTLIRELRPRLVLCRPGASGIAAFYPLRAMREPPTIVLLASGKSAKDEVFYDDGLIVTTVRTPVQMAALCQFIATAMTITARLDEPDDQTKGKLLVHPAVERFIDPAARAARARATPAR
ncbi:MAG: hypothetical protein KIT36_12185 [Alphaproteobacteria bacterium]|nr:hypothetical protein [Alphaproteobacteria bacterium]